MGTLEKVVSQLADAERQVASVNDARTTDRLRAAARGAIGKALGEIERSVAALDAHAAENEGKIAEKLCPPLYGSSIPHGQRAADVRAHLRALPVKERAAALRAIVAERDHEAQIAILSASLLASALSKRDHDALRQGGENVFASGEVNLRAGFAKSGADPRQESDFIKSYRGTFVVDAKGEARTKPDAPGVLPSVDTARFVHGVVRAERGHC